MKYSEDTLIQQTPAEYLEQGRGWESVYAYNNEDFGPESLLGREPDREVVIPRTLRAKTEALNHGLPDTAYDDVRQVVKVSASRSLAATNHEQQELIKNVVSRHSILTPLSPLCNGFEPLAIVVSGHRQNLKAQNAQLAQARDLILPKLMHGEVAA